MMMIFVGCFGRLAQASFHVNLQNRRTGIVCSTTQTTLLYDLCNESFMQHAEGHASGRKMGMRFAPLKHCRDDEWASFMAELDVWLPIDDRQA